MENTKKKSAFKLIDLIYTGMSAAIIAVCSWISIPVGSIPITLQTMAVCIVAGLFGWKRGTLSVVVYILLGAIGVPVFSGFKAGIGVLGGPTGGYIVGFLFTALIVGIVSDRVKGKLWSVILAMVVGILVCYAFGTGWFYIAFVNSDSPKTVLDVLTLCVFPYLIPDAVKIAVASVLVNRLKKHVK